MADTYYSAEDLDTLLPSRFKPQADTSLHGWARAGAQATNVPKRAVQSFAGMIQSAGDLLAGGAPREFRNLQAQQQEYGDKDWWYQTREVGKPRGFTDSLTDVALGGIAPELPSLLIPGSAVSKGAKLFGAGRAAPVVGDIAAGALSGYRDSAGEAGLQATEFGAQGAIGAMLPQRFRPLLRATAEGGAGYGIGVAGQALRGHDPFTVEGQTQAGVMAVLPFAQQAGRRLFSRSSHTAEPVLTGDNPPPVDSPSMGGGIPADWRLRNRMETPDGRYEHVFDTPQGEQRFSADRPFGGMASAPDPVPTPDAPGVIPMPERPMPEYPAKPRRFFEQEPAGPIPMPERPMPPRPERPPSQPATEGGELQPLRPLRGGGSEGGSIDRTLLHSLAGGGIGATVGYALPGTEEQKRNRAIMMGVGGAAIGGSRRLLRSVRSPESAAAAKRFMTGEQQSLGEKVVGGTRRFMERNFKLGRSQNLETAQQQAKAKAGQVEAEVFDAAKAAIPHFRTLTAAQQDAMDIYLSSDRGAGAQALLRGAGLPKEVEAFVMAAQGGKAELQSIVADALGNSPKGDQMRDTLGTWMYQPHKAYHSPETWAPTQKDIEALVVESRSRPEYKGVGDDTIRADIEAQMREIKNKGWESANIPGNKISQRLFTEKKKLTPAFRKFLGEITAPLEREIASITRLSKIAGTSKLISELGTLKDEAGRSFLMSRSEWQRGIDDAVASGDVQTANFLRNEWETVPDDPALGKMAQKGGKGEGMMAQRQVLDAMGVGKGHQIADWQKTVFGWFSKIQRPAKAAFTVLNPATHIHNIAQTPLQAITAGVNPMELFRNLHELGDPRNKHWLKWAKEDGMFDSHLAASELQRGSRDWRSLTDPTLKDKTRNAWEGLKGVYGKPDQWARGASYVHFLKQGLNKLGMPEKQARAYATEMTNRYTQNYGNVAPAVNALRNTPLINPFISYTAEMARIMKNLAQDVLTDPMKAKYGVSQRFQAMGKLAALFGAGAVITQIVEGGARMFGLTEEDQERLKNLVPYLPAYMKGKTMAGVGWDEKRGTGSMLNLNPWLPAEDFVTLAKNIASGDLDALAVNNPVIGGRSPVVSAGVEMATGRDPFTGRESRGYERWVEPVLQNFSPPLAPWGHTGQKLLKAFTKNEEGEFGVTDSQGRRETPGTALLSAAGVSVSQMNQRTLMKRQKDQQQARANEAKARLNKILRTDINTEAKDAARAEYQEERRRIFQR